MSDWGSEFVEDGFNLGDFTEGSAKQLKGCLHGSLNYNSEDLE